MIAAIGWWLVFVLLVLAVVLVFQALWDLFLQKPLIRALIDPLNDAKEGCQKTGFACDVATSVFFTVLPLVAGSFVFVFWRLRVVKRPWLKAAIKEPSRLVETAGEIVGDVVGRDDVCNVLIDNLRDRGGRLPYVIVGGVGIGKTAVLVRLTELLARRGAVPVPIRLRDARKEVDFLAMAREAFLRGTQSSTLLAAEAERAWGRLCQTDKIVVLADGLEEALVDSDERNVDQDRDHRVRAAVSQARRSGYPLVIASREHDALSALDASVLRLEPLNQEAALDYVEENQGVGDERRLGWIVDRAKLVETPLYLQMVRELHESGQLQHATIDPRGIRQESLETRGADRVGLRMNLADSWINALIAGNLNKDAARVPLKPEEREATVLQLAALACCGLAKDTLQVTFDMFEKADSTAPGAPTKPVYPELDKGLRAKLDDATKGARGTEDIGTERLKPGRVDLQVAASNGYRLGLVELRKGGVRFPHSTMQAYLGSMLVGEALKDKDFKDQAFGAPGRELLIALAMFARRAEAETRRSELSHQLCEAAKTLMTDVKKLELLTAAVDIDSLDKKSEHWDALDELGKAWGEANSWDEASREAKMIAVVRVGEAARRLTEENNPRSVEDHVGVEILNLFFQEMTDAVTKNVPERAERLKSSLSFEYSRDTPIRQIKADVQRGLHEIERDPELAADPKVKNGMDDLRQLVSEASGFYLKLYRICCKEDNYQIRLVAAQEIGAGGQVAFDELREAFKHDEGMRGWMKKLEQSQGRGDGDDPDGRYVGTIQAWLLPMLVGTVDEDDAAAEQLREWLEQVGDGMPLFLEAALAQGFKYAANRRPQHPYEAASRRQYLASRAQEMFKNAKHWYSRVTLLHALCLWALSGTLPASDSAERRNRRAEVERWMGRENGKQEHPFVREAGELVIKALKSRQPERFLWIDESSIVTTVGSRSKRDVPQAMRTLWIPPSAGWLVLDRRAQQLVADVLILLTLAERGQTAEDWKANLERINRQDLPLCLSKQRSDYLQPIQKAGVVQRPPGDTCKSGCPVRLCPYPPKGQQPYRVELSEAFCRKQRELVRRPSKRAGWQLAPRGELRRFWKDMEERART